jgi:hypothetical protein
MARVLELWASSLRAVKARMAPLFTQERVAASAGLFLDGLPGGERRKTGWMRAEAASDPGPADAVISHPLVQKIRQVNGGLTAFLYQRVRDYCKPVSCGRCQESLERPIRGNKSSIALRSGNWPDLKSQTLRRIPKVISNRPSLR